MQPNTPYDLVVSNFAATLTLSGAVSFTAHPTINSLTSQFCPPDFTPRSGPLALYCAPYATLTIVGSFFSDLSTLSVQITSPGVSSKGVPYTSLAATNVMFDSTNVLTCVLPDPGNWFAYSSYLNVQVLENATYSSNVVAAYLYYNAQSDPHITSIQGCSQPSPSTAGVAGCQVGDLITLVGVNFLASLSTQVQLFSQGDTFVCASARVLSSTAMTCLLPYMPGLLLDSVVPIRISNMNGRTSNWLVAVNYQSLVLHLQLRDQICPSLSQYSYPSSPCSWWWWRRCAGAGRMVESFRGRRCGHGTWTRAVRVRCKWET